MNMFLCADCDNLRDADDGCEEAPGPGFRLICQDCADEREAERPPIPDDYGPDHSEWGLVARSPNHPTEDSTR